MVATLDAYPDWKIPCQVIAIIPTADRQRATVEVRVGFDQLDPRILPDMGVKVAFQEVEEGKAGAAVSSVLLVPGSAVLSREGRDIVFVVSNDRAERRAVATGDIRGSEIQVLSGLSAGESVVVDAPPELRNGDAVQEKTK